MNNILSCKCASVKIIWLMIRRALSIRDCLRIVLTNEGLPKATGN